MKCCKVIVCCDNLNRRIELANYPHHSQNLKSLNDYKELWQTILDYENIFAAGVEMDTIIIFNGENDFFDKYDGTKTKNGTLYVRHRENLGGSFGGFNYAFENFKYDFYMFLEDDTLTVRHGYYADTLSHWKENSGFIALIGSANEEPPVKMGHCHGGVGLTSREVLDKVYAKFGKLPNSNTPFSTSAERSQVILEGEVPFTRSIYDMGYNNEYWGLPKWDESNHMLPYHFIKNNYYIAK